MKNKTILALLAVSAIGAQAAAIHTGLVSYWTLDGNGEDSASDYTESIGTVEDDLTIDGTAGAATISASGGLFGGAADFERSTATDGRLSAATSADVVLDGAEVTISLWGQFDDNSSNWQGLLANGEGDNYRVARRSNENRLAAALGGGDAQGVTGQADVNSGDWFHVVASTAFDGTNWTTSLFVNGVLEGTNVNTTAISNAGAPKELWIGNNVDEPDRMWDGLIDDVAIWERPLDPTEITEIYDAGLAGTSLGAIPEPTSGLLLGLGGLTVLLRRRR